MLVGVIQILLRLQPSIWEHDRPVLESAVGAVYPLGAAAILGLMALQRWLLRPRQPAAVSPSRVPRPVR